MAIATMVREHESRLVASLRHFCATSAPDAERTHVVLVLACVRALYLRVDFASLTFVSGRKPSHWRPHCLLTDLRRTTAFRWEWIGVLCVRLWERLHRLRHPMYNSPSSATPSASSSATVSTGSAVWHQRGLVGRDEQQPLRRGLTLWAWTDGPMWFHVLPERVQRLCAVAQ